MKHIGALLLAVFVLAFGTSAQSQCVILKRMGPADQVTSHMFSFGVRGKQFQFVEGRLPKGIKFHGRLTDNDVRKMQDAGATVLIMEPKYAAPDLVEARKGCIVSVPAQAQAALAPAPVAVAAPAVAAPAQAAPAPIPALVPPSQSKTVAQDNSLAPVAVAPLPHAQPVTASSDRQQEPYAETAQESQERAARNTVVVSDSSSEGGLGDQAKHAKQRTECLKLAAHNPSITCK
jgi:hypothetical protein